MSPLAALVTPNPGARGGGVEHHVGLLADLLTDKGWDVQEVGGTVAIGKWPRRLGLEPRAQSRAAVAPLARLDPDLDHVRVCDCSICRREMDWTP